MLRCLVLIVFCSVVVGHWTRRPPPTCDPPTYSDPFAGEPDTLPTIFEPLTTSRGCCSSEPYNTTRTQTITQTRTRIKTVYRVVGNAHYCLLGQKECKEYTCQPFTEQELVSRDVTRQVITEQPCPAADVICCPDQVMFYGRCMSEEEKAIFEGVLGSIGSIFPGK